MDNYKRMARAQQWTQIFIFLFYFLALATFGALFPEFGFKSFAFITFAAVILVIGMIPLKWGLIFTFTYIGLEGFLKVVSNYNPIIHVGGDVLVLFLCLKAIVQSFVSRDGLSFEMPPLWALFLMHFGWVLVTIFNPYSLGFVPSLAGAKLYVVMAFLFFFGFYQTKSLKDAHHYLIPLLAVTLLHTGFGIYQGLVGEQSVLSLHPRYAVQLAKYTNTAFRPFGLTNLPGGPAVFMALAFPFIFYFIFTLRNLWLRWLLIAYVPSGVFLFLLCQVRSSFLKAIVASTLFAIGGFFYMVRDSRKVGALLITATLGASGVVYFLPQLVAVSIQENVSNEDAIDRSLTVFDIDQLSRSRRGTWERFIKYASDVPLGAGFSRVGAAAGAFQSHHNSDPFYGPNYFFADNFWVASVVEEGLPGMFIFTLILVVILIKVARAMRRCQDVDQKLLVLAIFCCLVGVVMGLYGAESILYNPDSCFFWFLSGMALKIPRLKSNEI